MDLLGRNAWAHTAGGVAYRDGETSGDCPYPDESDGAKAWKQGFADAKAEDEELLEDE